jgi:Methyltransferase domain
MTFERNSIFHREITKEDVGLEIGPSYNPVVPKLEGWNVSIADHADKQNLILKYSQWGVDTTKIEDIDYIIKEDGLKKSIQPNKKFNYIIASHVIEHTVCLITFLQECSDILNDNGLLMLAIPDKRRCFDILKPLSTTGNALDIYHNKPLFHSPGVVFDSLNLQVRKNNEILWFDDDRTGLELVHSSTDSINAYRKSLLSKYYIDVHSWKFTPESFRLILDDLLKLELISFNIQKLYYTVGFEFFVILKKQNYPITLTEHERMELILSTYS